MISAFFTFGGTASHDINGCATKEELKADYSAGVLRRDDPRFDEKKRMCHRSVNDKAPVCVNKQELLSCH